MIYQKRNLMKMTEAMNRLICETPTDESGFRMF